MEEIQIRRIDTQRHLTVFDPDLLEDRRIDIIGCGATGSKVAFSLAKLGLTDIHIHDFDKVEEHNIANQMYELEHVGMDKTTALAHIIKKATGLEVTCHNEKVDGDTELGSIVFMLTDTMASRKEIFDNAIKYKMKTDLLIETRMGADSGRVYSIDPNDPMQVEEYEKTLYADEETAESACAVSISVGPTADIIVGLATWQMMKWVNSKLKTDGEELDWDNEILVSTRPTMVMNRTF